LAIVVPFKFATGSAFLTFLEVCLKWRFGVTFRTVSSYFWILETSRKQSPYSYNFILRSKRPSQVSKEGEVHSHVCSAKNFFLLLLVGEQLRHKLCRDVPHFQLLACSIWEA
jgi:hypothetical protein